MKSLTRIPAAGRRAAIIRATSDDFRSVSFIDRFVRRTAALREHDPSVQRMKTSCALRDLRRRGIVDRTPYGWRATAAGIRLLQQSEALAASACAGGDPCPRP